VFFRLACSIFYKATTVTSSFTCNVVFWISLVKLAAVYKVTKQVSIYFLTLF
jgi:hypothetical protein